MATTYYDGKSIYHSSRLYQFVDSHGKVFSVFKPKNWRDYRMQESFAFELATDTSWPTINLPTFFAYFRRKK